MHTSPRLTKVASNLTLTLGGFLLLWTQASIACSVHDHGCIYHSFNSTVNLSSPLAAGTGTSLVIYAIGTNNNQPSSLDFDNKVLLPAMTGDRVLTNSYTQPTGPYIVSSTPYGATHPPPAWKTAGDGALQVYPSQYQVVFNQNTAIAKHTGDLNGGENGNIPGATGCPNMPGKANCEAVVVTGNVPNGVYEQKVRIFNFFNDPNPNVDIKLGAYTTGQAILVSNSHVSAKSGGREVSDNINLQGNGAMSDTYSYEFYNRGFDPHAAGVASFDRSKSRISKSKPFESGDHAYQNWYRTTDTLNTKVWGDGWSEQTNSQQVSYLGRHDLGALSTPVVVPALASLPVQPRYSFKDCPVAPCAMDVYKAPSFLPEDPVKELLAFVRANPHKIPDANSALIPAVLTQYVDDRSFLQKAVAFPKQIWDGIQENDRRSRVFNEPLIDPVKTFEIEMPWAAGSKQLRATLDDFGVNRLAKGRNNWQDGRYGQSGFDYTDGWGVGFVEAVHTVLTPDTAGSTALTFLPVTKNLSSIKKLVPADIFVASKAVAKEEKYVDILSLDSRNHILYGDGKSGGHMWPGQLGKTTFPHEWSGDKIIHEIGDIATSPSTKWNIQTGNGGIYTKAGAPARWVAWEIRDGVRIRVVIEPETWKVITAFPDSAQTTILN